MSGTPAIAAFQGRVTCRGDQLPLALTLVGRTASAPEEPVTLTFAFAEAAPPAMPEVLEDVRVERIEAGGFHISSGSRHWDVPALSCHLHRDVAAAFFQAVVPRKPRWSRRLFWSTVLALLAHPWIKRLLLAFRRR